MEKFFTAKNLEEALKQAANEFNVPTDELSYILEQEPKKGFLGIGGVDAIIRVTFEEKKNKEKMCNDYIMSIVNAMELDNVSLDIKSDEEKNNIDVTILGDEVGVLIGRRGDTLDALQYLSSLVINKSEKDFCKVNIDSQNYRSKREKTLKDLARKIAKSVLKSGRSFTLEPMNPYERRIIHATIAEIDGVSSISVKQEPNRRIVISCTKKPIKKTPKTTDEQ